MSWGDGFFGGFDEPVFEYGWQGYWDGPPTSDRGHCRRSHRSSNRHDRHTECCSRHGHEMEYYRDHERERERNRQRCHAEEQECRYAERERRREGDRRWHEHEEIRHQRAMRNRP